MLRWRINLLSLGNDDAASLGLNVEILRWSIIALVAMIVAAQVAVSGGVGWVGLIIPHLARMLDAMKLYQGIREVMRELYLRAAGKGGALSWRQFNEIVHAGYLLDRKQYFDLLVERLMELPETAQVRERKCKRRFERGTPARAVRRRNEAPAL